MYRIPGRHIVCNTIGQWIQEMIWVYVIMKVFRRDIESISCKCGTPPMGVA